MGTPPAPAWATIFFAIHEETILLKYRDNLSLYRRYIDDVAALWIPDKNHDDTAWNDFRRDMNSFYGLQWVISERKKEISFLYMQINIEGDKLTTTILEKELNLYQYIPPHSAHPPGVMQHYSLSFIVATFCCRCSPDLPGPHPNV